MSMLTTIRSISLLCLTLISLSATGQGRDTTILIGQVTVQFDSDQSILSDHFQDEIIRTLATGDTLEQLHAVIEAHTDDVGTAVYNLDLSERRAKSIREFLHSKSFTGPIDIQYFGEQLQIDDNMTAKGRSLNRRAVLRLYHTHPIVLAVPKILTKVISGRVVDGKSGEGVFAEIKVNGKDYESKTSADSLGYFEVDVPENQVLKFMAFPNSDVHKPTFVMKKTNQEVMEKGVLIELGILPPKPPTRTIQGIITDENNNPLQFSTLVVQCPAFVDTIITDQEGQFAFDVPQKETVRLSAYLKDYFYDAKILKPGSNEESIKMVLPEIEVDRRYVAGDLLFVGNRDIVLPTSVLHLKSLGEVVRLAEDYCFKIEGHINRPGTGKVARSTSNFKLSEDRAIRIYNFLRSCGIEDRRICYEGFGNWRMLYPRANNATQQMLNRRVEVLVIPCE